MFRNLSPWEGRLALLFALALATAFTAGCEDPISGDDDDAVQDDDDDTSWSPVTLRVMVPYEWVGRIVLEDEVVFNDVTQGDIEIDEPGTYRVNVTGHYLTATKWTCVPQVLVIEEDDSGKTFVMDSVWEGEGICSLTPDGWYGTFNVSSGAGYINLVPWQADATENAFFRETEEYLLEGEIAEDLSWIYYNLVRYDGGTGGEGTIPRMEED